MGDVDEVDREYPLFASSIDKLFNQQQRLAMLEFPLRPPERPYDTENAHHVRYKPNHHMLELRTPEREAEGGYIGLAGKGLPHDSTLCALVKVDEVFALLSIDEIIRMLPDMVRTDVGTARRAAADEDPDYKPPAPAEPKKTGKAGMRALQVEVQKRETERQMETRMRSHAHLREQQDSEAWLELRMHGLSQGNNLLLQSCRTLLSKNTAPIEMEMDSDAYVKLISPSTWIGPAASASSGAQAASAAGSSKGAAPTLDRASLDAVKEAVEALFALHSVVTLADVRSWLSGYQPKPEARAAATIPDKKLHELLVGGGSITCVQSRYVLTSTNNPTTDVFRSLVLELLEHSNGLRKADVMNAAKVQGIEASDHLYNKVLKDLCVAQGAVWNLRPGGVF